MGRRSNTKLLNRDAKLKDTEEADPDTQGGCDTKPASVKHSSISCHSTVLNTDLERFRDYIYKAIWPGCNVNHIIKGLAY